MMLPRGRILHRAPPSYQGTSPHFVHEICLLAFVVNTPFSPFPVWPQTPFQSGVDLPSFLNGIPPFFFPLPVKTACSPGRDCLVDLDVVFLLYYFWRLILRVRGGLWPRPFAKSLFPIPPRFEKDLSIDGAFSFPASVLCSVGFSLLPSLFKIFHTNPGATVTFLWMSP